ncbi:MAG: phosphatidate cytidylyltransferase [Promicromonosporaceae bacterium]|nr:phosphatidate cytidylyltransferase [Promicromonosporaceae bacterium]
MNDATTTSPKAGRNLPAAIGVAIVLLGLLLASLAFRPEPFLVVVLAAVCLGLWEMGEAFETRGIRVPLPPLYLGTVGITAATFWLGTPGQVAAVAVTVVAVIIWVTLRGPVEGAVARLTASVFLVAYLPLMASFIVHMLDQPHGNWRIVFFLLLPIANDTGGYAAGVLFGKHQLAPRLSPKKSWEGLAGSVVAATVVGVLGSLWVLQQPLAPNSLLIGLGLGALAATTATCGDLAASLVKRDLGIKDMSSLLPGHGGLMDRLDSIVLSAPVVYLVFAAVT